MKKEDKKKRAIENLLEFRAETELWLEDKQRFKKCPFTRQKILFRISLKNRGKTYVESVDITKRKFCRRICRDLFSLKPYHQCPCLSLGVKHVEEFVKTTLLLNSIKEEN